MAKALYFGLLPLMALISLVGCSIYPDEQIADQVIQKMVGDINNIAELSMIATLYYGDKKEWPASIKTLQLFCAEKKNECPELDWQKYSNALFVTLPDGSLKIELNESPYPNTQGGELNVVMTLPKPGIKED